MRAGYRESLLDAFKLKEELNIFKRHFLKLSEMFFAHGDRVVFRINQIKLIQNPTTVSQY